MSTASAEPWARDSVLVHSLADEATVLAVRGEDARTWLNGQVTNDVRALDAARSVYTVITNVKGKVLADAHAVVIDGVPALIVPAAVQATLLPHFEKYIIMEDVSLEPLAARVITLQGPRAADVLARVELPGSCVRWEADRLGTGGFDVLVHDHDPVGVSGRLRQLADAAASLGGGLADPTAWGAAFTQLGRPRFGVDFDEHNYPQEAGLGARAVSFNKGCYLGQEVVCMLENRGQLVRRLVRARLGDSARALPAAGTEVFGPDNVLIGHVTSAARASDGLVALAYVKRAFAVAGGALRIGGDDGTVTSIVGDLTLPA